MEKKLIASSALCAGR